MSHPNNPNWTLTDQRTGEVIPLTGAHATIGRRAGNTIVLDDAQASRHHATIFWQGGTYVVQDAGSSNGTFLNGQRVTGPAPLQPGAVLQMGDSTFVVNAAPPAGAGGQAPAPQPMPEAIPPQTPPTGPRPSRPIIIGMVLAAVAVAGLIVVAIAVLLSGSPEEPLAAVTPTLGATETGGIIEIGPGATASPTTPAATTEPTASPTPPPATTEVPTSAPTDSPVPHATETRPQPTDAPPSPTPSLTPSRAPSATPTPTQTPPPPTLLAPREEDAQSLRGQVTFRWAYPQPLKADQAFQVLIWKEGQAHNGAAQLWTQTEQIIDLDVVLPQRGGTGEYFWTVIVREKGTEKALSPEARPWRLIYAGAEAPPPNKCAGVCEKCTSWDSWSDLCAECNCPEPDLSSGIRPFVGGSAAGHPPATSFQPIAGSATTAGSGPSP